MYLKSLLFKSFSDILSYNSEKKRQRASMKVKT